MATKTLTLTLDAARFEDFYDCLEAAKWAVVEELDLDSGWTITARWTDNQRTAIIVEYDENSVPAYVAGDVA
jgi:hypothetical protein